MNALAFLFICLGVVHAYYVPGTYPQEFKYGDTLEAYVNSLTSFENDLPYDYYSMPFCKPVGGVKQVHNMANPGTILEGIRIETSPYRFEMKIKRSAQLVCEKGYHEPLTKEEVKNLKHKIDNNYRVRLVLDNLPVTTYDLLDESQEYVRPGFELGYSENGKYYIYNHLVFNVLVHMTHGEYSAAMKKYKDVAALDAVNSRKARKMQESRDYDFANEYGNNADVPYSDVDVTGLDFSSANFDPDANLVVEDVPADILPSALFDESTRWMVVGFEVSPCSIARVAGMEPEEIVCGVDNDQHIPSQEIVEGARIVYTYDVFWQESKIVWTSRWDAYLRMPGGKIHWFSILNSTLVVVVMAAVVAMILVRTIRKDLAKYEQLVVEGGEKGEKDESGWKLVAGDVFRPPPNPKLLAVQVGTGVQVILTTLVTLSLAALGFLSPAARGALLTTSIVMYVMMAVVSGFVAVYIYGLMTRSYAEWVSVCWWTSLYYPGITLALFTFVNILIHHTGSTGAVPLGAYFTIVFVWFVVSIPLTYCGGLIGQRMPILSFPVKTNQIPRLVPTPPITAHPITLFFAAGVLPFGAIFIELYFALTSLWLGYFYYLFGFVFIIALLLLLINAEISVLCTYAQLCVEDHRWWWASFRRGGSVAMYLGIYAACFAMSTMSTFSGLLPVITYISYLGIFVTGFYLAMGTLGLVSSFFFTYIIFRAVKHD